MKKDKKTIIILIILIILVIVGIIFMWPSKEQEDQKKPVKPQTPSDEITEPVVEEKVDIIDINSKTRPYAVSVNNTPVAVKVQEGLNNAYLVYEIPTEGNTSRLLAFYKDIKEDLVIGTVRSARHNFVDYALESDAILSVFGWSHYAEDDMKAGSINYLQGLNGYPFYRNNPEGLATEHTAYTSMNKLKDATKKKKFKTESDNTILLNYDVSDIDLSTVSNAIKADKITIPYGNSSNTTSFVYDENTKMYNRYAASKPAIDYKTKENVSMKNIITYKIKYKKCDDNYYWDLATISKGSGYFITNGYAIPINFEKTSRSGKTKYTYQTGTIINGVDVGGKEIVVSDGRTWIGIQTTSQKLTIK